MSKRLGGIIDCKDKTSSWRLIAFPDSINSNIGSTVLTNVGEKPTVILYTYIINRLAGTPSQTKTDDTMSLDYSSICYIGSRIG